MKNQIFLTLMVFLLCSPISMAQSGGTLNITQSVIASGGGQNASGGGNFAVAGTIGQSLAGTNQTGGTFNLRGGFWSFQAFAPTAAQVSLSGRVFSGRGSGIIRRVRIVLLDTTTGIERSVQTNPFGYYRFDELEIGRFYTVRAESSNFTFAPDNYFLALNEDREDVNFTGSRRVLN